MKKFLAFAAILAFSLHPSLRAEEPSPAEDPTPAVEEPNAEPDVVAGEDEPGDVEIVVDEIEIVVDESEVVVDESEVVVDESEVVMDDAEIVTDDLVVQDEEITVDAGADGEFEVMEIGDPRIFFSFASGAPELQRASAGGEGSAPETRIAAGPIGEGPEAQGGVGAPRELNPDQETLKAMDVVKSTAKAQGFSVNRKFSAAPGASKALKKDGRIFLK